MTASLATALGGASGSQGGSPVEPSVTPREVPVEVAAAAPVEVATAVVVALLSSVLTLAVEVVGAAALVVAAVESKAVPACNVADSVDRTKVGLLTVQPSPAMGARTQTSRMVDHSTPGSRSGPRHRRPAEQMRPGRTITRSSGCLLRAIRTSLQTMCGSFASPPS